MGLCWGTDSISIEIRRPISLNKIAPFHLCHVRGGHHSQSLFMRKDWKRGTSHGMEEQSTPALPLSTVWEAALFISGYMATLIHGTLKLRSSLSRR